jgi:hypothetical protein
MKKDFKKTKENNKKTVLNKNKKQKSKDPEVLFIPAGVLLGMGFGFLYNDLVAGLFIGLGLGFFVFAIVSNIKNKK